MVTRSRVLLTTLVTVLVAALGTGTVAATAAAAPAASSAKAKSKVTTKQRAAARKRAAAKREATARAKRRAAAKKSAVKQAGDAVREIPVTFTVRNTNTSKVPCAADGKTYEVKGKLVGQASRLDGDVPEAVALYVHGLGYGAFFWNYKGVDGYDFASMQAGHSNQVSVVIDRLGYGASGKPDGNLVCYGSEADYLNQIVTQLRSGAYTADGAAAKQTFKKVALVGHSAGGFMVEASAYSYKNIDALAVVGFSNAPVGLPVYPTFAQTTIDCQTAPLPNNYAFFGKTDADFKAAHFFNADPAVVDKVTAMRAPDPCMDTGSALPAVVTALMSNSSITVPVLIVNGANDALFGPPGGDLEKALFTGSPDVTQITLGQTGHALTLGRTNRQFRAIMGDWLKGRGF